MISLISTIFLQFAIVLSQQPTQPSAQLPSYVYLGPGDNFQTSKSQLCGSTASKLEAKLTGSNRAVALTTVPSPYNWPASKTAVLKTNLGNCTVITSLPPAESSNFAPRIVALCQDKDLYLLELKEELGETAIIQGPLFVTKSLETKHTCAGVSYTTDPRPAVFVLCRPASEKNILSSLSQTPMNTLTLALFKVSIDLLEIQSTSTIEWKYPSTDKAENLWVLMETSAGSEEVIVEQKTTVVNFTYIYLYAWGSDKVRIFKEVDNKLAELQPEGQLSSFIQQKSVLDITAFGGKAYITLTKTQHITMVVCDSFQGKDGKMSCNSELALTEADPYEVRILVKPSQANQDFASVSLVLATSWTEWNYVISSGELKAKASTVSKDAPTTIETIQGIQLIGNIGYIVGSANSDRTWTVAAFNLTTPNDVRYGVFAESREMSTFWALYRRNSDEKTYLYTLVNGSIEFWETEFPLPSSVSVFLNESESTSAQVNDLELKCVGGGDRVYGVKVGTQSAVNSGSLLSLSTVEAYLGQSQVTLQANARNVSGNGVGIQLLQSAQHNASLLLGHVNLISPYYSGPNMTNILGIKSLGDDVIVIHNASTINFIRCRQAPKSLWYMCNFASREFAVTGEKFVNAFMVDKIMYLVTRFRDPQSPGRDITKIRGVKLDTAEQVVETKVYQITAQKAEFAVEGADLFIYLLTSGSFEDDRNKIHQMKMALSSKTFADFKEVQADWGEYLWPSSFAINPHDTSELYVLINPIATVTRKVSVIRVKIGTDMKVTIFPTTFELDGSFKISICAMKASGTFALIDYTNTQAIYVNLSLTHSQQYQVPLKEFGSENIQGHNCDAENGVLQIVGNTEYMTSAKLYTIRLNSTTTDLANRVHSVVAIGTKFTRITSMFNEASDEMVTVLFGSTTAELSLVSLKTYGPHIYLNTSRQNTPGKLSLTHAASFPGRAPKSQQSTHQLILTSPQLTTKIDTVSTSAPSKKIENSDFVDMEAYITINGPYLGVANPQPTETSAGIQSIKDRVAFMDASPFAQITQTFDDTSVLGDYLLATVRVNSTQTKLQIYKGSALKIEDKFEGTSITSIGLVESNTQLIVLALLRRSLLKDAIIVWACKKGSDSWSKMTVELDEQGYKGAHFRTLHKEVETVLFTAYKNKVSNQVVFLSIKVAADKLEPSALFKQYFDVKITDLELSVLSTCPASAPVAYAVVGLMNEEVSRLLRIEFESGTLRPVKAQIQTVTLGSEWNVHQNTTVRCDEYFTTSISCFKSSNNANSYLTVLEGLAECQGNPVAKSQHRAKLANLVNMRPFKAELRPDFVSVVVKNDFSSDSIGDSDPGSCISLFKDNYLLVLYKLGSEVSTLPVQPFRIMGPAELGSTSKASLSRLSSRFLPNAAGSASLFVSVGVDSASVRVHELNTLRVSFVPKSLTENTTLAFKQLDSKQQVLNLSSVFNLSAANHSTPSNKTDPDPSKKVIVDEDTKKGLPTVQTLLIGSLLIVGALIGGYFLGKRNAGSDHFDGNENADYNKVKGSMIEGAPDESFTPEGSDNRL